MDGKDDMTRRVTRHLQAALIAAGVWLSPVAHGAEEPGPGAGLGETQACVPLRQIDDSRVIDDKTILLKMTTNPGYKRIDLAYECYGLKEEGSFVSATSISQLCRHDILRLKQEPIGSQCIISRIVNIDEAEAKTLLESRKK